MYLDMLKKIGVVFELGSQKSIEEFSKDLVPLLKHAIKDRLYKESPLRNNFQVRPLDVGELPLFYGGPFRIIYEDGQTVMNVSEEKVCVMLFETCCNTNIAFDALVGKTNQEVFNQFLKVLSDSMLAEETRMHGLVKEYEGKGIFIIRADVQVLVANDYEHKKMGFSIFETIGVVKCGGSTVPQV